MRRSTRRRWPTCRPRPRSHADRRRWLGSAVRCGFKLYRMFRFQCSKAEHLRQQDPLP